MYCVKLVIMLLYCDDSMPVGSQEAIGKVIMLLFLCLIIHHHNLTLISMQRKIVLE